MEKASEEEDGEHALEDTQEGINEQTIQQEGEKPINIFQLYNHELLNTNPVQEESNETGEEEAKEEIKMDILSSNSREDIGFSKKEVNLDILNDEDIVAQEN